MAGPKYVSDFEFPADAGFHGSAGVQNVKAYARGGRTKAPVKKAAGGALSDGKNWIADAVKKPGALRKSLGVKEGQTIPAKKLEAAAEKPGKLGRRARLAETFKGMKKATGGGVAAKDVHKHERNMHPGKPLTKLARGSVPRHSDKPMHGDEC